MSGARKAVGALLAVVAFGAAAQDQPMQDSAARSIEFKEGPGTENKIRLPAAPKQGDLIFFDAGPARRGFEHFVDGASVNVGSDGVIRYTLVIRSDMGAENVAYEGIRCVTRERKVYAHGRRDGSWREIRDPEWKKIGQAHLEGPIFVLYEDFFCPGRGLVRSAGDAIAALKHGIHPNASDEATDRAMPLGR
ncbi:MAG: hypothetical protein HC807_07385 [Gammaproteobacteria bacterium]|nr:hypothetical protein [Gammaproteobacteria bacterium]